jgi:hypothetical protein
MPSPDLDPVHIVIDDNLAGVTKERVRAALMTHVKNTKLNLLSRQGKRRPAESITASIKKQKPVGRLWATIQGVQVSGPGDKSARPAVRLHILHPRMPHANLDYLYWANNEAVDEMARQIDVYLRNP